MIVGLNRDGKWKNARKSDDRVAKSDARDPVFSLLQGFGGSCRGANRRVKCPTVRAFRSISGLGFVRWRVLYPDLICRGLQLRAIPEIAPEGRVRPMLTK